MEVCCTFQSIAGGVCGADSRDRKQEIFVVPLLTCSKDISRHMSMFSFTGPENEVDLILCRAGIFTESDKLSTMTICPLHRAKLGLGWTRGASTRCRIPPSLSNHGKKKGNWPKGERGITKSESEVLLRKTGVFVPVGSGICRKCRELIRTGKTDGDVLESVVLQERLGEMTMVDEEVTVTTPEQEQFPVPETPYSTMSVYTPSGFSQASDISFSLKTPAPVVHEDTPKERLNSFLTSRDISPIRSSMTTSWDTAAERTKRHYVRKAKQVVFATLEEIAPSNSQMLFNAIEASSRKGEADDMDTALLEALVESYENSNHWSTRRQILSVIADKVSFSTLQKWIPDLTRYRYNIARHHRLLHGRGTEVPQQKNTRMYVAPEKLDHFLSFITSLAVVQDLPFGERTLKLSSSTELKIPNVIRTSIPEQIVRQYQSYCKETGFTPMSRSSLLRILHVCSASLCKSLQGLDYISSEGAKAFDDIAEVVDKLGDNYQGGMSWSKELIRKLKLVKRYLKGDYKVHVSQNSRVPDHCRPYALSYPSDPRYTKSCDHPHDLACDRCNLFPSILQDIESVLETIVIPHEEREELKYLITQSRRNVEAWKAHLLRSVNQDEARLDVLNGLEEKEVLVVLDWAMKFLPRKYRESQADWYGKRGIPWHISVATRKCHGEMEVLKMIHVFQSCSQDSIAVLAVMEDVIKHLKDAMPGLKSISFRQDNAGCYHSAVTILGLQQLASQHNVAVRMDFSDPQGGKGACDRKAATVKSHMRAFLNSGNDIETAEQMKTAIESDGGIRGVRVILCALDCPQQVSKFKWEGVSFVNNIVYEKNGMKVWRAYGIGNGKCLPWSDFEDLDKFSLPHIKVIKDASHPKEPFGPIKARKSTEGSSASALPDPEYEDSDLEEHDSPGGLFVCPEEGCIKAFQRYSSFQNHLDVGKHKYVLERETFLDKAMVQYAEKLEQGASSLESPLFESASTTPAVAPLSQGWALKFAATSRRRLTKEQKKYLAGLFTIGERTGRKSNPNEVSKSMRKARSPEGYLLFQAEDYLSPKQITSFFSRLAKKSVLSAPDIESEEEEDSNDDEAATEKDYQSLREKALDNISIQHPIMYDTHNICEMASTSTLSKFSISMLQEICQQYELDTAKISVKKKEALH